MSIESENSRAFKASMSFNAEAARSGLFAAAIDIMDTMKKNDIPNGEAALLTGAVEMAAQLWMRTMLSAGKTRLEARKSLEKQVRTFAIKHSYPENQQEARPQ